MAKHHDKADTDTSSTSTYIPSNSNVPTTTGGAVIISLIVILAVCLCLCLQLRQLRSCLGRHVPWLVPSYLSAPAYRNKDDLVETGLYEKYCHQNVNNADGNSSSSSSIRSQTSCLVIIKPLPPLPN